VPPGGTGGAGYHGWSWLAFLLPYYEQGNLYPLLDMQNGSPWSDNPNHVLARSTPIPLFFCPSYTGPVHCDVQGGTATLTNYKALGGTHPGSVNANSKGDPMKPQYPGFHPDAALYRLSETRVADISDGTSNTAIACETIEPKSAPWIAGVNAMLAGLPQTATYQKVAGYYTVASGHTYLQENYDTRPYKNADYKYGPSSRHPDVVNHVFGDGSVHAVSRGIDASLYMHLITREGQEPVNAFFAH